MRSHSTKYTALHRGPLGLAKTNDSHDVARKKTRGLDSSRAQTRSARARPSPVCLPWHQRPLTDPKPRCLEARGRRGDRPFLGFMSSFSLFSCSWILFWVPSFHLLLFLLLLLAALLLLVVLILLLLPPLSFSVDARHELRTQYYATATTLPAIEPSRTSLVGIAVCSGA